MNSFGERFPDHTFEIAKDKIKIITSSFGVAACLLCCRFDILFIVQNYSNLNLFEPTLSATSSSTPAALLSKHFFSYTSLQYIQMHTRSDKKYTE